MKQVIVGDSHGRSTWCDILNKEIDFDRFIFIGDYVDSFDISGVDQLSNLQHIIDFKKRHPEKVILLVGNHDFQYMSNGLWDERYSGFQPKMYQSFKQVFDENAKLFQACFEDEYGTVYSHAGLTETFVERHIGSYSMEQVNSVFKYKPSKFRFSQFDHSGCGDSIEQSCIWVRPNSLFADSIQKFQVVGHTTVNSIYSPSNIQLDKTNQPGYFFLIDALPRQYLTCTDGKFKIENHGS